MSALNVTSPLGRPKLSALYASCLRFSEGVLALSNEDFARHCYVTILGRAPEPGLELPNLSEPDARIDYWTTTFQSIEYDHSIRRRAGLDRLHAWKSDLKSSLGWQTRSTARDFVIDLIWAESSKDFLNSLAAVSIVVRHNLDIHHEMMASRLEMSAETPSVLFSGLMDIGVELTHSLDKIDMLIGRIERLEKCCTNSDSSNDASSAVIETANGKALADAEDHLPQSAHKDARKVSGAR